ncbi:uncharacterized protein LOC142617912 [Castanea sativa]|uniref:uncharacterized protein LOC142617912 n=1 Tax=Castanea sativa TaxID=21020 RepID=UPI003F64DC07
MENRSNTMCRNYHVHHPENTDDEYAEQAFSRKNGRKTKKCSSSDESESSTLNLNFNLRACQEGDDHDMDANKCPTTVEVKFSPTELAPIINQFRYSFIIYAHGKMISCKNLYTRLASQLSLFGPYQIFDQGLGFFLLKLSNSLDHTMVVFKEPLSIPNYCVSLLNWAPNFRPSETNITHVDVWVQLPELPLEYYAFLSRIASTIGVRLLKIDPITETRKMCKFARFCVRVDVTRPLPALIKIGEIWQRVKYEGLEMVCSQCRCYGHVHRNCLGQLTSATTNASRGQASTSNVLMNSSTGHRKSDASKIVMSESGSTTSDDSPRHQVRPCKDLHQHHQREISGPQRLPLVQNQNIATGTESNLELIDQPKSRASVIAESNTRSMQRMTPLPGEGTSLSPTKEGTQIHPAHKDIPSSMTESLKPEEGFPDEFSIAASSNTLPQYYTQHLCHQPAHEMVKKAFHSIPTQLHPKQPQTSSSVTALPRPSPMGKESIQRNSKGIHQPKEKEISNTPVMEVSTDIQPTLYSIKPEVASLDIGVSETGMTNQHVIRFLPRCPADSETVSQSNLEKLLYVGAEPNNIILIQTLKCLQQHKNLSMVLLFGKRSIGNDVIQALEKNKLTGSYYIDSAVFDDGVWLFWRKEDVEIDVSTPKYSHQINASVRFLPHRSNTMRCGTAKSSESNAPYAR